MELSTLVLKCQNGSYLHLNLVPPLHFRSLGMLKEAEIIEQQRLEARSQPQPDYRAQWADYYR